MLAVDGRGNDLAAEVALAVGAPIADCFVRLAARGSAFVGHGDTFGGHAPRRFEC